MRTTRWFQLAVFVATFAGTAAAVARASTVDDGWASHPVWHDGLVERAVYTASRVVYGKPRAYEAVFFTNKERHDPQTLTKATGSVPTADAVEVWKHNQVESVPTPNYAYHFVTTAHLATADRALVRLDCASQEFCGASFKQVQRAGAGAWDAWSFSYMPGGGRATARLAPAGDAPVVAWNALPLWLRGYDFAARPVVAVALIPDQKSNLPTPTAPVAAEVRHAGVEDGAHRLEIVTAGTVRGTFWMATDRLHVMVRQESADGQRYELKSLDRVDYWTIK